MSLSVYDVLRRRGVAIGKDDFMGNVPVKAPGSRGLFVDNQDHLILFRHQRGPVFDGQGSSSAE